MTRQRSAAFAGIGPGLLQPEAEPERRRRGDVDRPAPCPDLLGQPRQLGRLALHESVGRSQGVGPLVVQAREPARALPRRLRRGPHEVIDEPAHHLGEHRGGGQVGRLLGVLAQRAAGVRHRTRQPLGLEPCFAGQHRLPSGPERRCRRPPRPGPGDTAAARPAPRRSGGPSPSRPASCRRSPPAPRSCGPCTRPGRRRPARSSGRRPGPPRERAGPRPRPRAARSAAGSTAMPRRHSTGARRPPTAAVAVETVNPGTSAATASTSRSASRANRERAGRADALRRDRPAESPSPAPGSMSRPRARAGRPMRRHGG